MSPSWFDAKAILGSNPLRCAVSDVIVNVNGSRNRHFLKNGLIVIHRSYSPFSGSITICEDFFAHILTACQWL